MNGMAEVLAGHRTMNFSKERYCQCGAYIGDWATLEDFHAHQAAMLTAARFGPVKEAAAQAWSEGVDAGRKYPADAKSRNPYRA